jgi:hypothetical protein
MAFFFEIFCRKNFLKWHFILINGLIIFIICRNILTNTHTPKIISNFIKILSNFIKILSNFIKILSDFIRITTDFIRITTDFIQIITDFIQIITYFIQKKGVFLEIFCRKNFLNGRFIRMNGRIIFIICRNIPPPYRYHQNS